MFKKTLSLLIANSLILSGQLTLAQTTEIDIPTEFTTNAANLHPVVAREIIEKFKPLDTASSREPDRQKGDSVTGLGITIFTTKTSDIFPARQIFKSEIGEDLSAAADEVASGLVLQDKEKIAVESLLFHLWAMFQLAKNGFMEPSFLEQKSIIQSLFLFSRLNFNTISNNKKNRDILEKIIARSFSKVSSYFLNVTPEEKIRIEQTLQTFHQRVELKSLKPLAQDFRFTGARLEGPWKGNFSFLFPAVPSIVAIASLNSPVHGESRSFLAIVFELVALWIPGLILFHNYAPGSSRLTTHLKFKTKILSQVLTEDCKNRLESLRVRY